MYLCDDCIKYVADMMGGDADAGRISETDYTTPAKRDREATEINGRQSRLAHHMAQ